MPIKQIFKTQITDVDSSARDVLGSIRWENDKCYKYVKLINDTASVTVAGVAGDPCAYTDGGVANNEVTLDNTSADSQPIVAGFLTASITGTYNTAYYCWVQVSGLVTVPTAVTSGVIGSGCMMAAGDKTLTVATGVIGSCGTLVTATASNNKVLANCPR